MTLDDLVARAYADPAVIGLVLSGSQPRGMATEHSDADVFVVVHERGGQWTQTTRTPELDTIVVTTAELADKSPQWNRYAFRGAQVLLDRGGIAELVAAQATLTPEEADSLTRQALDGYMNFVYRAVKNHRDGRADLARLEEIESVPWFLTTLFALYRRVRPYNKYLRWELQTFPLPPPWTAEYVIGSVLDRPTALYLDIEKVARDKGFGDVVDGWGDELPLIRRSAEFVRRGAEFVRGSGG
jgi:hypothetical protein